MVDLRRTLTLADRRRRRPIARRGRGGGALGSRASPGPLGVPFRRARQSVGLAGGFLEFFECMDAARHGQELRKRLRRLRLYVDCPCQCTLQRKVNGDAAGKRRLRSSRPRAHLTAHKRQSTPEEQLQHKRPARGRDRSRDRAAASSRDVAATAAARDRTGKRNEATAGPDAGLRAAEPPAREAGLLQRGWTFIIEAFIEPPQTYAGVL